MKDKMNNPGQKAGMNKRTGSGGQAKTNNRKPGTAGMDNRIGTKGQRAGAGMETRKPKSVRFFRKPLTEKERQERRTRNIVRAKRMQKQKERKLVEDVDAEKAMQKRMEKDYMKVKKNFRNYKKKKSQNYLKVSQIKDLVDRKVVYQAVSAIRKLENKVDKPKDVMMGDTEPLQLQVTLIKVQASLKNKDINTKTRVKVKLPNNPCTDATEVLLVTRDIYTGRDFSRTINYFERRLMKSKANTLITQIIPVNQLRLEYMDFEARKNLASSFDVVLCDDKVMPGIEKRLGKHFLKRNKYPIECCPMKSRLKKEIDRALSTAYITFGSGNCATIKIGNLNQTDEQLARNIVAAVRRIALSCPGGWDNVQNLSIKRRFSESVPIYVNFAPMNSIQRIEPKPLKAAKMSVVSGSLTTQPTKSVIVYPDGNIFLGPPIKEQKKKKKKTKKTVKQEQVKKEQKKRKPEERITGERSKRLKMLGKENFQELKDEMMDEEIICGNASEEENALDGEDNDSAGDECDWKQTLSESVPGEEMQTTTKAKKKKDGKQVKKDVESVKRKSKKDVPNVLDEEEVKVKENEEVKMKEEEEAEHWLNKIDKKRKPKGKKGKKSAKSGDDDDDDDDVDLESDGGEDIDLHERAYLARLSKKLKEESSKDEEVDAWAEYSDSSSDMED